MTPPTIEERLALLEAKVARLSGEATPEENSRAVVGAMGRRV